MFSMCATTLTSPWNICSMKLGRSRKPQGEVDGEEKNKHKEDVEGRRKLDEADRKKIAVELEMYSHPLND